MDVTRVRSTTQVGIVRAAGAMMSCPSPTDCATARDGAGDQWEGGGRAETVGGEPMGGGGRARAHGGPKINTLYGRIIGNEERKEGKKRWSRRGRAAAAHLGSAGTVRKFGCGPARIFESVFLISIRLVPNSICVVKPSCLTESLSDLDGNKLGAEGLIQGEEEERRKLWADMR